MSDTEKFQPIESTTEQLALIKEAVRNLSSAMLWTKNQSLVLNTHLTVFNEDEKTFWTYVPKETTGPLFEDHLAKNKETDCYFSVSLLRANIFFKAAYAGWDSGGLKFKFPKDLYKVQRRNDLRLLIPDGFVLKVTFQDPVFPEKTITKNVSDISAGGLSLMINENEGAFFTQGLKLQRVTIKIKGKEIQTAAEVRHISENPKNTLQKDLRVGIQFSGMKEGDRQHISTYVFEETRKLVSKFL